jgi:hypothetical protein
VACQVNKSILIDFSQIYLDWAVQAKGNEKAQMFMRTKELWINLLRDYGLLIYSSHLTYAQRLSSE